MSLIYKHHVIYVTIHYKTLVAARGPTPTAAPAPAPAPTPAHPPEQGGERMCKLKIQVVYCGGDICKRTCAAALHNSISLTPICESHLCTCSYPCKNLNKFWHNNLNQIRDGSTVPSLEFRGNKL